jgi:hypothetical protein
VLQLSIARLALVAVSALFLVNGVIRFFRREERQTLFKLLSYLAIWGSILTLSLFPNVGHAVSQRLGFGENLNTLIFFGFVVAFVAIFKLVHAVERLERNISEVVRREALEKLERIREREAPPRRGAGPPPGSSTGPE